MDRRGAMWDPETLRRMNELAREREMKLKRNIIEGYMKYCAERNPKGIVAEDSSHHKENGAASVKHLDSSAL